MRAEMTGTASLGSGGGSKFQVSYYTPPRGVRREAGSEGSLKANLGLDEQEPGTRPARWGNPAMDGDAR